MKPLSPIERMIDATTGYVLGVLPELNIKALEPETQALLNLADAAEELLLAFKSRNVERVAQSKRALAEAVAQWVRLGG